ncbi:serine/threonine-protein kinase [Modestobacter excelsi]|uniref:serine/threonine-protein kinase n=1 Tax=Modestobacter excelsi TaxID=2213161 RepID=UPI00110CC7AC|nr:serine/threonine-protein kinase [Modestobacter excelsi]
MTQRTFGPYEIESLLGSGGMGEVYRARDTRRERLVALKVLPDIFRHDQEYLSRFRREQHVAARLREPHVIPIHDYGDVDGRLYIDMRLVDGEDIGALLRRDGLLPPSRAVHLISQVGEALDAAHAEGLVHRDVKPSNVLVTAADFVYVVDFGIARPIGTSRTALTITGATVGTLDYMAPERFTNQPIDGRADTYSLACLLYECLTGTRPFPGEELPALMYAHLYSTPPRPSSVVPDVPGALDEVVARGMAKRPDDRYETTPAFTAAARAALRTAPPGSALPAAPAPAAFQPTHVVSPPPVGALGIASGAGGHRSVDQLPTPAGFAPPAGGSPTGGSGAGSGPAPGGGDGGGGDPRSAPGHGSPPPPDAGRRRSARGPGRRRNRTLALMALVAVVVAALVLVSVVFLRSDGSGGTAAQPSAEPTAAQSPPPPEIAASVPIPAAGGVVPVGATPGYIQVAPNGRFAYIANRDAGVVTVFDTALAAVTATITIDAGPPQFIAFSPDGRTAYVTVFNKDFTVNDVVFLDTATNEVSKTVPVGHRPYAPATTPDGRLLYVPSHNDGRVDIVDTTNGEVVGNVPTPPNPHWVAFSKDGKFFYTADHESGVVTVFDSATNGLITQIPVGRAPHSLAVSPDGTRVSVVNFESNTLSVIDTATNAVVATVDIGLRPQDVTYAPDGKHLYTANVDDGTVDVVDTTTNVVTARIPTGDSPSSISVLPNGRQAYVTNLGDGTVRILDITAV